MTAILWDCVTTWLANELYEGEMEEVEKQLYEAIDQLLEKAKVVVIVSNEVLDEPLSNYEYTSSLSRVDRTNSRKPCCKSRSSL